MSFSIGSPVYVVSFTPESGKKTVEVSADTFTMDGYMVVFRSKNYGSIDNIGCPVAAYRQSDIDSVQLKEIIKPGVSSPVTTVGGVVMKYSVALHDNSVKTVEADTYFIHEGFITFYSLLSDPEARKHVHGGPALSSFPSSMVKSVTSNPYPAKKKKEKK